MYNLKSDMPYLIYGNGSCGNHGCEAIIRGTAALLGVPPLVFSADAACDNQYGLHQLADIYPAVVSPQRDFAFWKAYLKLKTTGNYMDMDALGYLPGIRAAAGKIPVALSAGGDNYCYPHTEIYAQLNRLYRRYGIETVLWGCSVEPELIRQEAMQEDLRQYSLIVPRESITYDAVREVTDRVVFCPDPAFFMEPISCPLSDQLPENLIGINISPHILTCESQPGMAYENYRHLIAHILQHTDAAIALIPHVVWPNNDDRQVLRRLREDFHRQERLILVEDHTAPELKSIIARCRMFVGARTHATIAAYSSAVPTLVVGYSVKARGIARDLFGNETGYVLPVQSLMSPDDLTHAFIGLMEQEASIRVHLTQFLPGYLARAQDAVTTVKKLMGEA